MAIQFRYSGDRDKAQSLVPFAVRNFLAGFKQRMGFQKLKQNKETYMDTEGNIIQITAQNITGENYQVSIFCPIVSGGITLIPKVLEPYILILTTVSNGWEQYSTLDGAGNSIYKSYFYTFKEKESKIEIVRTKDYDINYACGLNLSIQTGTPKASEGNWYDDSYVEAAPGIYSVVADNWFPYEEEIGAIDWRRYMNSQGTAPDWNLKWGDYTYGSERTGFAQLIEGADRSQYYPKSSLIKTPHSRHAFILQDKKVYARWFSIGRSRYEAAPEYPLNFTYDTGIIQNFCGRLEYISPARDGLFEWYIESALLAEDGVNDGERIRSSETWKDLHPDICDWTYHVPIVAVSPEAALIRKVVGDGDQSRWPCGDMNVKEELFLGNLTIDTAEYDSNTEFTIGTLTADKTVLALGYDSCTLTLSGYTCPELLIGWAITFPPVVPGYVHLERMGDTCTLWAVGTGCLEIVVTASCGGCGDVSQVITIDPIGWCIQGQSVVVSTSDPVYGCSIWGGPLIDQVFAPHGATQLDWPALTVGNCTAGWYYILSNAGCWDHYLTKTWRVDIGGGCAAPPDGDDLGIGKGTQIYTCYRASCTHIGAACDGSWGI
jgi:hypothetical protein